MWIVGIILLIAPGLFALFCNAHDFTDRKQVAKGIAKFFIFIFLATMITFTLITCVKGKVTVNLIGEGEGTYYLNRSTVFVLLGTIQIVSSVVLGILERRYHDFIMRVLHFLWNDNKLVERSITRAEESKIDRVFSGDLYERNKEIQEEQENDLVVRDVINKKYNLHTEADIRKGELYDKLVNSKWSFEQVIKLISSDPPDNDRFWVKNATRKKNSVS